jgi:hypothetical protein
MKNMISHLFVALLFFTLSGCVNNDDENGSNQTSATFPDYSIINAPSENPNMPWYVNEYFASDQRLRLERNINLNSLKLGMYELTQYPYEQPSRAQIEAADKLVDDAFDIALRNGWFGKEKGLSDGYEKMFGDPVHFVNIEYVFDGETLNPEKPEVLMYYKTKEGDFLMGIMFLAIGERGPQVAGPLSRWHYHIDRRMCYERGVLPVDRIKEEGGSCETGAPNIRSPEMLHVWFFDHPEGKFATTMGLSEEVLNFGIAQILELEKERT